MSAHNAGPYRLSIASSGTDSPALSSILSLGQLKAMIGSTAGFSVACMSAALTGTVTVQTVPVEGGSTWTTLQQNGADIALTALKTVPINTAAFRDLRIHSSGAEGAQRDFDLTFQLAVTS